MTGLSAASASAAAAEPVLPRVTDRYGEGEMDEDAMHDILQHNVFAPRQFAVYKRADLAHESTVMGIDQLKHVRRESTAHPRPSNAAAALWSGTNENRDCP